MDQSIFTGEFSCNNADLGDLNLAKVTALNFVCDAGTNLANVKHIACAKLIEAAEATQLVAFAPSSEYLKGMVKKKITVPSESVDDKKKIAVPAESGWVEVTSGITYMYTNGYNEIATMPFYNSWFVGQQWRAFFVDTREMNAHKVCPPTPPHTRTYGCICIAACCARVVNRRQAATRTPICTSRSQL